MYKDQVRLLKCGHKTNGNENEAENEKQITYIRHKQNQAQAWT